jgi:alkanesulfonate monooxygenase SsuD/methylene tetrahydromethanopterin reductase-like flavin-dependent oxidoreductase (luciferase family)
VRHAVFLPPFDDFADPRRLVELAVAAEESGWDGFFLWDHILRWPGHEGQVGDTWTALAAIAARTSRMRLGPAITPLARHRVAATGGRPGGATRLAVAARGARC